MTGSAKNRLWHVLTSALDISETVCELRALSRAYKTIKHCDKSAATVYCRSDPLRKDKCGTVRDNRLEHFWITLMCMSAVGFLIKVRAHAASQIRNYTPPHYTERNIVMTVDVCLSVDQHNIHAKFQLFSLGTILSLQFACDVKYINKIRMLYVVLRSTGQGTCVDWTRIDRWTFHGSSNICKHLLQQELARYATHCAAS